MVSNSQKTRARQDHKERTHIHAALAAFQQIECGQFALNDPTELGTIADRFFLTGETLYGTSQGIQTLVREGYSLERPIPSLGTDNKYILASLGAEVIHRTSSVDLLLESPAQDLQYRVGLFAEQLLYQQMDCEDKAMTRLCERDANALPAIQYERNALSTLLKEFFIDSSDITPDMQTALLRHNEKMTEYATLCLEDATDHAYTVLVSLLDHDTPGTTYQEAKARFASLYIAFSEMYGIQPAFRTVAEQHTKLVHNAAVEYITEELETYQELIETAKKMSGGDRDEINDAVRAITFHEDRMRNAFRKTHELLSTAEFRDYTQQYSALQNDDGYTNLNAEISGPHYFDYGFADTVSGKGRVTAIIPSHELSSLVNRRYADQPTVIRRPQASEVHASL